MCYKALNNTIGYKTYSKRLQGYYDLIVSLEVLNEM